MTLVIIYNRKNKFQLCKKVKIIIYFINYGKFRNVSGTTFFINSL